MTPRDRRRCGSAADSALPTPTASQMQAQAPTDRPTMLGLVTNRGDFEELRVEGRTAYETFGEYLHDIEGLMAELKVDCVETHARAFSPEDFEAYCTREGLPAGEGDSHLAYIADPAGEEEWVRWTGEPLAEFLLRVERAHERGQVRRMLERMLGETAEAALTGVFPEQLLRIAYAHGAEALRGFLLAAGEGAFTVACGLFAQEEPVTAWADLWMEPDGVLRIEEEDLDLLCEVLCVGHALNLPGVVTLSGVSAQRGEVGWEWTFDGQAYCRT
ncbi:hypothetical protein [Streptacidiphilus fuscans]|uniref:Uncharacterized protein n=1 Tax=Streptacidiphilus fuscans TaxID=2789292 RepID=A0A931B1T8_9ACTN|nr:hypothetical protein [Streptacidiphilus fuscans]MBF9068683.1 hypothetical protein [Streptacidiphilus fuscans]